MAMALRSRPVTVLIVSLALVALLVVLRGAPEPYTLRAHFVDAGQLVKGDLVTVGGRQIGTIPEIRLTDANQAEVVLKIEDEEFKPLRRGTIASIRTASLPGVANRFVELTPGPAGGAAIPDGGVLREADTRPIVDLDSVLNGLDAPTRARLQSIVRGGATTFAPGYARDANLALRYLNPALSQTRALSEEVLVDQAAVERLLTSSATLATVLAARRTDLDQGIANTATTLRALARERWALQDAVRRAPGVLRQGRSTLRHVRQTLPAVRPALREAQPVAAPVAGVLTRLPPTAREARPVVVDLRALTPSLRRVLAGLPALAEAALPALRSTTTTLRAALAIFAGLRPYAEDVTAGLINGFGGTTTGSYDANGHFARIALELQFGAGGLPGLGALFPGLDVGDLGGYRTGDTSRCPGGAAEPARDESNPWIPDDSLCDPQDDQ